VVDVQPLNFNNYVVVLAVPVRTVVITAPSDHVATGGRHHDVSKQSCPAFGQTCAKCHKKNHFAAVCRSRPATTTPSHQQNVREIDETESLLALDNEGSMRVYSNVYVNDHMVRFLLDCGSTVNILPRSIVSAMGHSQMLRPARALKDV